jgi:hypothetical protein
MELVTGRGGDQESIRLDVKDLMCEKHGLCAYDPNEKIDRDGGQMWLVPEREYEGLVET